MCAWPYHTTWQQLESVTFPQLYEWRDTFTLKRHHNMLSLQFLYYPSCDYKTSWQESRCCVFFPCCPDYRSGSPRSLVAETARAWVDHPSVYTSYMRLECPRPWHPAAPDWWRSWGLSSLRPQRRRNSWPYSRTHLLATVRTAHKDQLCTVYMITVFANWC